MRRIIITALLALTALGGVASADRFRGNAHGHARVEHRTFVQRPSYRRAYRPSVVVSRPYAVNRRVFVRRPIYVQRPVIRYRYTNYYQRPAVIVENYPTRYGYIWVAGSWNWGGYEWQWTPGHYEADPNCNDEQYQQYQYQQQPNPYDQQQPVYDNGEYYNNGY